MAEPFLSEVRIFSFGFPPKGWALCNGQLLPIAQNQALFSLLGTTFGGDGRTTFGLPNLRGRAPLHFGAGYTLGEAAGSEAVTLTPQQMPQHFHFVQGSPTNANALAPAGGVLGGANATYRSPDNLLAIHSATISQYGGSQPHANMQPYLVLSFCIALIGIFPSQN